MQPKVLIIDDEAAMRELVGDSFKAEGFETIVAEDGIQGLEIYQKEHPDVILLDMNMPRMEGTEMLKKLRQAPQGKNALVIVYSNLDDPSRVAEVLESSTYHYLIKDDWSIPDVVRFVKEKLAEVKV